ncbi:MAG: PEP-CTERM system TPR-repeat protein PrsT [Burkholderiaceae bacterium]|nr:PEP-CTERM system TPR-repeat protein PrsT [Burkholderiales bacterium]MCZ8337315.1 PEP-CTERM system TPR-repeat protein PrsT [Burkholderiaceae bacterium]
MPAPTSRPFRRATSALALAFAAALSACQRDTPETSLAKARESFSARDLRTAEIHLKNTLQARPDTVEARLMLAEIHTARRDMASAQKEWRRALDLGAPVDRALPGLLEAMAAMADFKGLLESADAARPESPQAAAAVAYWRGVALASTRRAEEARVAFEASVAADPRQPLARVALASLRAGAGDRTGAEAALDAVLAEHPASASGLLLKSDLQLSRGDAAGARVSLERAVAAIPADPGARIRLITLLLEGHALDDAEAQHAELRKIAPAAPMTNHLRAAIDLRRGRFEAAGEAAQNVLKANPDFLPAVAIAATVALQQNQLEQAERYARKIVDRAPESVIGARLLGSVHLRKNEPEKALQIARAAIERNTRDAALLGVAGEAALRLNDVAAATGYFERASRIAPNDAMKLAGLGIARLSAGKLESGFADLEAASRIEGASVDTDLALISARLRARQFDQAIAAADRLITKTPDSALAHNMRGTALTGKGDLAAARQAFDRALQIDPSFFAATANLAQLDAREQGVDAARKRFEALLQRDPRSARAMMALAALAPSGAAGDAERVKLLTRAREADPTRIEPALALAQAQVRTGRARDAIPMLQQTVAQHPADPRVLDALGTALSANDQKQQAVEAYEQLVALVPKSAAAHARLAEARIAAGDLTGAATSLKRATELDVGPSYVPGAGVIGAMVAGGRSEDARRLVELMSRSAPRSATALSLQGDLHFAEKRFGEAAIAYRSAFGVQRTALLAAKLHQSLARAGRAQDAEASLRDSLKSMPDDVALRMYAAEAAIGARQWRGAADLYRQVLAVQPGNVVALNNLAWSLKELKDPQAREFAEAALSRAPRSPAVLHTLGTILVDGADPARGSELLRDAVQADPEVAEYRLSFAVALAAAGNAAGARTQAEELLRMFPDSPQAGRAREIAGIR